MVTDVLETPHAVQAHKPSAEAPQQQQQQQPVSAEKLGSPVAQQQRQEPRRRQRTRGNGQEAAQDSGPTTADQLTQKLR